jgi:hypothetical protein
LAVPTAQEGAKTAHDSPRIAGWPRVRLFGALLLAYGLDERADEVFGGIKKVFERAAVIRMPAAAGDVGSDVHDRRLEPVQPVMQPAKVVVGNDRLAIGKAKRGGPATSLEGPLAVGGRAELPRSPCPGPLVDRTVTPAAASTLG